MTEPSSTVGPATSAKAPRKPKPAGPAPSRIVAAAASVSAGIGLVALMAGAQQDLVVEVNPTPITIEPGRVVVEVVPTGDEVEVRVVEAASPAPRPMPQAQVVSQSEGS